MEESDTKDYIQRNYIEETKEESLLSEESSIKEDEVIHVEEETKNDEVSESLEKESSEEAKIEEGNEKCDLDSLNFSFLDQYGKIHRLSSYKGKVIFLNCWATWCSPCRSSYRCCGQRQCTSRLQSSARLRRSWCRRRQHSYDRLRESPQCREPFRKSCRYRS